MAKSPESVPVNAKLVKVIVLALLFVNVTGFGPPAFPTAKFPHVTEVGDTVACAAAETSCTTPHPERTPITAKTAKVLFKVMSDDFEVRSDEQTACRDLRRTRCFIR